MKTNTITRALFLALSFCVDASKADVCDRLEFEPISSLSLQDLARLSQQEVTLGKVGTVVFIPFDEEDYPWREGLKALGIVFARTGDVGESPVGGYILVPDSASIVNHFVHENDKGLTISFRIPEAVPCTPISLEFELRELGRVYVNNTLIGTIR